jgi:hypothetical protein
MRRRPAAFLYLAAELAFLDWLREKRRQESEKPPQDVSLFDI